MAAPAARQTAAAISCSSSASAVGGNSGPARGRTAAPCRHTGLQLAASSCRRKPPRQLLPLAGLFTVEQLARDSREVGRRLSVPEVREAVGSLLAMVAELHRCGCVLASHSSRHVMRFPGGQKPGWTCGSRGLCTVRTYGLCAPALCVPYAPGARAACPGPASQTQCVRGTSRGCTVYHMPCHLRWKLLSVDELRPVDTLLQASPANTDPLYLSPEFAAALLAKSGCAVHPLPALCALCALCSLCASIPRTPHPAPRTPHPAGTCSCALRWTCGA